MLHVIAIIHWTVSYLLNQTKQLLAAFFEVFRSNSKRLYRKHSKMPETVGLLTCTMCNNHSTASSISNEVKVLARSTNSNLHRGIRAMVFQRGLSFDRTGNRGKQISSKDVCLPRTMHISSHIQKQINRFSYSLDIGEYTIQWLAESYTKIQETTCTRQSKKESRSREFTWL